MVGLGDGSLVAHHGTRVVGVVQQDRVLHKVDDSWLVGEAQAFQAYWVEGSSDHSDRHMAQVVPGEA